MSIIAGNVIHDQGDYPLTLGSIAGIIPHLKEKISNPDTSPDNKTKYAKFLSAKKKAFIERMDVFRDLLLQIYSANLAFVNDEQNFSDVNLKDCLDVGLKRNAMRFGYDVEYVDENFDGEFEQGKIYVVNGEQVIFGDESRLGVMFYNLTKNPLKIAQILAIDPARARAKEDPDFEMPRMLEDLPAEYKISVVISTERVSDDCLALFIRDTGVGISYDEMRDEYTRVALEKTEAGDELNGLEQLLLSEAWRSRVTPCALNRQLLHRGESFKGGTGVGLDLVRNIVDAHQGHVEIYDHPKYGAGVRILLADGKVTDPVERMRVTKAASMKTLIDEAERILA